MSLDNFLKLLRSKIEQEQTNLCISQPFPVSVSDSPTQISTTHHTDLTPHSFHTTAASAFKEPTCRFLQIKAITFLCLFFPSRLFLFFPFLRSHWKKSVTHKTTHCDNRDLQHMWHMKLIWWGGDRPVMTYSLRNRILHTRGRETGWWWFPLKQKQMMITTFLNQLLFIWTQEVRNQSLPMVSYSLYDMKYRFWKLFILYSSLCLALSWDIKEDICKIKPKLNFSPSYDSKELSDV